MGQDQDPFTQAISSEVADLKVLHHIGVRRSDVLEFRVTGKQEEKG